MENKIIDKVLKKVIIKPRDFFWCNGCVLQARKLTDEYNKRLKNTIKLTIKELNENV